VNKVLFQKNDFLENQVSSYTMQWQLSWNKSLYDYKRLIRDIKEGESIVIPCSKGNARMKIVPHESDKVFVVCGGQIILEGLVVSEFEQGTSHQQDKYCLGPRRPHASNQWFILVKMMKEGNRTKKRGFQRTWVRFKE
jgi:hypothetical protein